MKPHLRLIAALVIMSLVAIFGYQIYWLVNLYRGFDMAVSQHIEYAMRTADYEELMMRAGRLRGDGGVHNSTVSVSDGTPHGTESVRVAAIVGDVDEVTIRSVRPANETDADSVLAGPNARQGGDYIGQMTELLQQGLHDGLNALMPTDIVLYDSLLTAHLAEAGIDMPHLIRLVADVDTTDAGERIVAQSGTLVDIGQARRFTYSIGTAERMEYRLYVSRMTLHIMAKMVGVSLTSLAILLVLAFSFWYMIHTIVRQRTLDEMKTDFTHNVTHELKTPIAVAYAACDALLYDGASPDQARVRRMVTTCRDQLSRLSTLVEQILAVSTAEGRTPVLRREVVALQPLLDTIVDQYRLKTGALADIMATTQPSTLSIEADRIHLFNMIDNLVDNAVKYSQTSCIWVRIEATPHKITVRDHGIGIPHDKIPFVFDRFYRVPHGDRQDVRGYGLGLHYVKTMAELHGWTVSCHSEDGVGSEFTIVTKG